jgi:hypothetical protein
VIKKNVLLGLILVLGLVFVACGDDGEQPPGSDGGADAVAGDGSGPQPDVYVPPGCEAECLHEGFYLCNKDANGKCVECLQDIDCTNNPNAFGSKCNNNKCVCDNNADCKDNLNGGSCDKTGTTPKCTCKSDADCKGDIPWGGKCGTTRCECKVDADCAGNGNGTKCHTNFSKCTCENDAQCTKAPYTKCNPAYSGASYRTCQKPCNTIGNKCLYYLATNGWPTIEDSLKCDPATGACAQCTSNNDCSGSSPICDTAVGKCVACKGSADCAMSENGSVCDTSGTSTKCKCNTDADCKGTYPLGGKCNTATNKCHCMADGDCGGNAHGNTCYKYSATSTTGRCTCKNDAECAKAPYTKCALPLSSSSYKYCMKACTKDADCTLSSVLTKCNLGTGKCVACKRDADCTGTQNKCDMGKGVCVGCKTNADCATSPDGSFCDTSGSSNYCKCKDDSNCKGAYPWGNKCNKSGTATTGTCRCDTNANCTGNPNGPTCYTTFNKCTCKTDAECKKAPYTKCGAPYTSSSYRHCRKACQVDTDCPSGLKCNAGTGACYQCQTNADCTGTYKLCKAATGTCVQCKATADCTGGTYKYCNVAENKCVQCKTDADCASNTTNKYCVPATGSCISCKTNAHCATEQFDKTCDVGSGCVECKTDANCGVNSLGNKCSGTICVCTKDADCANRNTGHKCDSTACSCAADTDCPAGKKCTGSYVGISICQ